MPQRYLLVLAGFAFWLVSASVTAQTDAFRAVQNLSPAEQKAALQALGQSLPPGKALDEGPAADPQGEARLIRPSMPDFDEPVATEELRIEPGSTVVVEGLLPEELSPEDIGLIEADVYRARLIGSRSFRVDARGILKLEGIGEIPLAGLTADEAAVRLGAEPLLKPLSIGVTVLPLTPIGLDAIEPFGYSLFDEDVPLFDAMPPGSTAVPADYVLGPGDVVRLQLFGAENYEVELEVSPEGMINFPRVGPQPAAGLTFEELKARVEGQVSDQLMGTQAAVSLGRLKKIRVFVVGDVRRPGAYDISGLARITNALYLAGGVDTVGTLRRIELRRAGRLVETLDLYDLILKGDTRKDRQLEAGDVILVPPVGDTVTVGGEILRPAVYELRGQTRLDEFVEMAGGLRAGADRRRLRLERVSENGARRIETIDLQRSDSRDLRLRDGDVLQIFPVLSSLENLVEVSGQVSRPGAYAWSPGMRITDLLPDAQSLGAAVDLNYVLIRRESGPARKTVVISADLAAAQAQPGSVDDVPLQARDRITVFERGVARTARVQAVLDELAAQARSDEPLLAVSVSGDVNAPGTYPLEQTMRVSDLLRAGGGLKPSAFVGPAELTRYTVSADGERVAQILRVDLEAALGGDPARDLPLEPYDILVVKTNARSGRSRWSSNFRASCASPASIPCGAARPSRN